MAIIEELAEQNIRTHATHGAAALVLRDEARALNDLRSTAALGHTPDDIERIEAGLQQIRNGLNTQIADFEP
jgi:hypothetical protein